MSGGNLPRWRKWLRFVVPWVVTAGVIAFIVHSYSIEKIMEHLFDWRALQLAPIAVVVVFGGVSFVVLADMMVVVRAVRPPGETVDVSYFECWKAKVATALIDIINYHLGHAIYAVWVARRTRTDAMTTAGVLFYIVASDFAMLNILGVLAVILGGDQVPETIRIAAPIISGVLLLFMLTGPFDLFGLPLPKLIRPWRRLSVRVQLGQLLVRTINLVVIVFMVWWGMRLFGMAVPLWAAYVFLPVILFVGSVPINVAGFGAVQAAWLLFEPWAEGERIIAFQLAWLIFQQGTMVLRGAPFVKGVMKQVEEGSPLRASPSSPAADRKVL